MTKKKRPETVRGCTRRITTGCGKLYVTLNSDDDGELFEIFIKIGKAGGCAASQSEAIGRLLTIALRCGASIEQLIKQLRGISCHQPHGIGPHKIMSCSDAVAHVLSVHIQPSVLESIPVGPEKPKISYDILQKGVPERKSTVEAMGACPDCGGQIRFEEGCKKCSCGWTQC